MGIEEDSIRKYIDNLVLTFGWKNVHSQFLPFPVLDVGIRLGGNL